MDKYKFTGKDGSMGLKHLHRYGLEPLKPSKPGQVRVRIHRPDGTTIVCPYETGAAFSRNWVAVETCADPSTTSYAKGCRCAECREAHRAYCQTRKPRVPARVFCQIVDQLLDHGVTIAEMCEASHLSRPVFDHREFRTGINHETAQKFQEALPALKALARERSKA